MSECPACCTEPLVAMEAAEGVRVELCRACKGMLIDAEDLEQLAGAGGLDGTTRAPEGGRALRPCLRCNTETWQARCIPGLEQAGLYACGACAMVWLLSGELERLRAHGLGERRRAHARTRPRAAPASGEPAASLSLPAIAARAEAALQELGPLAAGVLGPPATARPPAADLEAFDRISFERGAANLLAAPVALLMALGFCATAAGRFFGSLIGMPFHELGHALASWLSSRFAVPLPFFTVWHEEQSLWFGLLVAALLVVFGARSWRERRRFGVALATVLVVLQLGLSWLAPVRLTSMLQILSGALGEIVLGSLVLVAFHFPLPDRLRWDFWRWPALAPGAISLAHALLSWRRASRDVRYMPWGAAIGSESDGDMNRLVNAFGWRAHELASFYWKAALLSVLVLFIAQVWAWQRARRARRAAPGMSASTLPGP